MKSFTQLFVWAAMILFTLSLGCAQMNGGSTSGAGASTSSSGSASLEATGPNRVSQGTQGDSLSACLARIPSDATAGQRMIAERTCQRDAENRASIDAVPGQ